MGVLIASIPVFRTIFNQNSLLFTRITNGLIAHVLRRLISLLLAIFFIWVLFLFGAPNQAQESITITVPNDISAWGLSPLGDGVNTISGTLMVETVEIPIDKGWYVEANDLDITTTGHMTKFIAPNYLGSVKLGTAMQIQGPGGTFDLPTGGNVVTGSGTIIPTQYQITFKQKILWMDFIVTNPASYRIVITFTGGIQQ